jgi:hypothetical protein
MTDGFVEVAVAKALAHQRLPGSGPEREALRTKGQFWTPDWVAEAMAAYVLGGSPASVFDPAVGEGAFLRAVKRVASEMGRPVALAGRELHPEVLERAQAAGICPGELDRIEIRDFVLDPPPPGLPAIIANPPYIRHHRIDAATKTRLRELATRLTGKPLDGRAGLHVFFLMRALSLLAPGGRLAFIIPADTFEGIFARPLWAWIARDFRIEAVVSFSAEATPFPGVDTNALVVCIRNELPVQSLLWCRCGDRSETLKEWFQQGMPASWASESLAIGERALVEALATGLSRQPVTGLSQEGPVLGDYARVMRGIATGDNHFFFLTPQQVEELKLPREFLVPAVGRTRDILSEDFTEDDFNRLARSGRPCYLVSVDGRTLETLPFALQQYLAEGVARGLPQRSLISQRKPWYKMEVRRPPPFLFAYLGRRNSRFIRNRAGVVPLTGFLCVYARRDDEHFVAGLSAVLRHPRTVENLKLVGKSYGGGAIKVEPRALERLPLPLDVVQEAGLECPAVSLELGIL